MSIPDALAQQLEKTIRSLHDIKVPKEHLLWAIEGLIKRVYSVRAGRKPKLDKQKVFDALTTWRNKEHARDGKEPSPNQMALFVAKAFSCPKEQAKKLAKTYRLWELKGCAQLTKTDLKHMEKNFAREWRESENTSQKVDRVFADLRSAQDEFTKYIKERTRNHPKPKGRPGKLIKTKEDIFRLLGQSHPDGK